MEQPGLTYFEKLEKIYVLTETGQMLREKMTQLQNNNEPYEHIQEDLNKIEQEISAYTNGAAIHDLDFSNISLVNPALYTTFEDSY
ncbi:hypothetical protein BKP35_10240 [Anaerobacillus arseniciselenatis]|uniref:Uncharacterized protein n=1 Tax=Anaerobacillus arseniciselenatis TaxID=85682 RepID=A0A1S2LKS0_9BACI|nr:hypothetical protein [Anaerobacillus arseniciselenatis]OIJ12934.1 hypothetical protein BKP35_10240 [Anaerobacillus arseniciselenatis]